MSRRIVTADELSEELTDLPGWKLDSGKLVKNYHFKSFAQAIGWMVSVALYADKIDHHPDWSNSYNKVNVELITHDLESLSTLDVKLAKRMESLFSS
jgi:4a-hydroxytetrahydrobiopterin dehydratase